MVIVDSGGANLASLQYALARLGAASVVSQDAAQIRAAHSVLLPGVGSAGAAMQRLQQLGLDRLLPTLRQPVLGICLGMQLLFDKSDEGNTTCLGIVGGRVGRLQSAPDLPVPHMGWNTLRARCADPLLDGLLPTDRVYFVHSFAAPIVAHTSASCDYSMEFSAVIAHNNFHGVQFHPERSGVVGARLLANFLKIQLCN